MDHMKFETPDLTAQNIEKIAALFPGCVTEGPDGKGGLKKAINFELLRQMLSDDVLEGDYLIATVCNGVAYGGGFRAAPMADLQDGVLDVIMVKKMSRMRIAGVLSKYKNGLHYQNGRVVPELSDVLEYRRAQKVLIEPMDGKAVITNIDGECTPADSLSAQVLPLAARFVLPAPLYAQFEDRAPAVTA